METHLAEWLGLTLRWGHVITGVAWIGTSFYFNWLNGRLSSTGEESPAGTDLLSVHGGAFYRVTKLHGAPERLPQTLHWFKWEAYATWLTGFALLVFIYYLQAGAYLVRPGGLAPAPAVGLGVGTLAASWLVYDGLCRSALAARPAVLAVLGVLILTALSWTLTELLTARAAFLHIGSALGTIMAANVWRVIIPGQQQMVSDRGRGLAPGLAVGREGALRSLHNNYLTLPVLFLMVSGHYSGIQGHPLNWVLLPAVAVLGAGVRHWFNLRNLGRRNGWLLPASALGLIALAVVTAPRGGSPLAASASVGFADVRVVIAQRCAPCHSAVPTMTGYNAPPAGVALDTPEEIRRQAERIYAVAVASENMPLGNVTGMTGRERAMLGGWLSNIQ